MTHEIEKIDLRTRPTIEEVDGHETWSHTGPHVINTGVVDGEVSFDLDPEDRKND
ncbi:hypothetical protein [Halalkalicoccus jeotgali]|uniref:Uncharacterized protein n=1 Tax=Halalkalicoccus jeotgali (strain DSM 18796 / CECT 7217 / JCM 14584 / KCTC 4019 / B3) TaxID=795797 RepID=D8J9A6_HALJB|nr:hypothetical protein [Halalkalicoccus jeotgali]ADJ16375.1 hypothetical protein HacjB3_14980 [Halalkalicoccus jeotgali B3]ELY37109.1 hypothetical protein C497_10208 [Halalkalicoccus jeotgali B3]